MSSFRWTFVGAIAVAALVAFTVYDNKRSHQEEESKQQQLALFKFKSDEIAKVDITTIYGEKVFEKKSENWKMLQPIADSADEQTIRSLLNTFAAEKSLATVAEKADPKNDATFGFDAPISRVKLTTTDGRTEELKVGRVKAYDGSLYVRIDNDPKVLLAGQALGNQIDKQASEYRDKRLYRQSESGDSAKVSRFEIRQNDPDNKTFPMEMAFEKNGESWKMTKGLTGNSDYPVLGDKVQAYLDQVKATRALSFFPEAPKDKAAKPAAIDKPSMDIRLYAEKSSKPFFEIDFGATKGKLTDVTAKSSDVDSVVTVYKAGVDSLKKHVDDFLDKKYPFDFKSDAVPLVTKIRITTRDVKLDLVRKGLTWESAEPSAAPKEIDNAKVDGLVAKLRQIEAVRILEPIKKNQGNAKLKNESNIILSQDSGEPVFEFSWGDAIIEKASAGKPESKYYPAHTNLVARLVGVSEFSVRSLELGSLVKQSPASPTPGPKTSPTPRTGSGP